MKFFLFFFCFCLPVCFPYVVSSDPSLFNKDNKPGSRCHNIFLPVIKKKSYLWLPRSTRKRLSVSPTSCLACLLAVFPSHDCISPGAISSHVQGSHGNKVCQKQRQIFSFMLHFHSQKIILFVWRLWAWKDMSVDVIEKCYLTPVT